MVMSDKERLHKMYDNPIVRMRETESERSRSEDGAQRSLAVKHHDERSAMQERHVRELHDFRTKADLEESRRIHHGRARPADLDKQRDKERDRLRERHAAEGKALNDKHKQERNHLLKQKAK